MEPTKKWQHENLVTFSKQLSLKHSFFAQLKWNAIKTSLDGWNPSPSQSICRKKMDPPWKPLWLWLTFRHGKIHHESQHRLTEILGDDQSRLRLLQGFSILWVKTIEKNRGKTKGTLKSLNDSGAVWTDCYYPIVWWFTVMFTVVSSRTNRQTSKKNNRSKPSESVSNFAVLII